MTINSHIYSPYIHFLINSKVNSSKRTYMNCVNFIINTIISTTVLNTVVPFLSVSLNNPFFKSFIPYNKYFCFVIIAMLQLYCLKLLKNVSFTD